MIKKIVVGAFITVISGGLIYGAVNRTQAQDSHAGYYGSVRQNVNRSEPPSGQKLDQSGEYLRTNRNQNSAGLGSHYFVPAQARAFDPAEAMQAKDWNSIQGTILEVTEDVIIVQSDQGDVYTIEGRMLRFAQDQGFITNVDHRVQLTGFSENEEIVLGEIRDLNSGLSAVHKRGNWTASLGRWPRSARSIKNFALPRSMSQLN